jgi:hypothetical protein
MSVAASLNHAKPVKFKLSNDRCLARSRCASQNISVHTARRAGIAVRYYRFSTSEAPPRTRPDSRPLMILKPRSKLEPSFAYSVLLSTNAGIEPETVTARANLLNRAITTL